MNVSFKPIGLHHLSSTERHGSLVASSINALWEESSLGQLGQVESPIHSDLAEGMSFGRTRCLW